MPASEPTPGSLNAIQVGGCLIVVIIVIGFIHGVSKRPSVPYWTREDPLVNPIAVTEVVDGELMLEDGRRVRPAGVVRSSAVSVEEYDAFLRVIVAQGVEIEQTLRDGGAVMAAEPRFHSTSGTGRARGGRYWAGTFIRCPLSEMLVYAGYAEAVPEAALLTPTERWRLQGARRIGAVDGMPWEFRDGADSLRYGPFANLDDYETFLEFAEPTPPTPKLELGE